MSEGVYIIYLFDKGVDKIFKKVGEEVGEVIIVVKNCDYDELKWEVVDLLYYVFVLFCE